MLTNYSVPSYTIVAPSTIRVNAPYQVNIKLLNASVPAQFHIKICNTSSSLISKSVSVGGPNAPVATSIVFDVGQWKNDSYKLIVTGKSSELNFKEEKRLKLQFEQKSFSIFIQTDKAKYKPEQLVQFRVIVVNGELLPTVAGTLDVFIAVIFVLTLV